MKHFLIFLLLTLASCDTPGLIKIVNDNNESIVFSYSSRNKKAVEKSVTIKAKETENILYGFGTRWTDEFLLEYASNVIDSLHLNVGSKYYYCSTEQCKKAVFNKVNRKSKRELEIVIDSAMINTNFTER